MVGKAIQFEPTGPLLLDDYDLLVEAGRPGVDLVNVWGDGRDLARALATTPAYGHSRHRRKKVEMLFAHLKRILKLGRLRL